MKDKILSYVEKNPYCTFGDLCSFYDGKKNDLVLAINTLLGDGDLLEEDKHYVLPAHLGLIKATITSVKDHFAFASVPDSDDDMHIQDVDMNNALLGDIVYLRYNNGIFKVVKIVKRRYNDIIAEVIEVGIVVTLKVNSLSCANTSFILDSRDVQKGDIVSCTIKSFNPTEIKCHLNKVLGQKNAPFMDVTKIILENDAPIDFPAEVEEQVLSIPQELQVEDYENRLDLRNDFIVTIDGDDSKDFDDAISVSRDGKNYLLGVHIADVSHYVTADSPLDKEAVNRGTSIYVTDRVVPMLPFALSNGICSLNEGVDRLTISCIMKIDENGHVISSKIQPSVMKSRHRLTYNYVNKVIAEKKNDTELEQNIELFYELALKVRALREARGSLDLDVGEIKIHVDEKGFPIGIEQKVQGPGEKLIEVFMILANEEVATTVYKKHLPFIYRIHEDPSAKRLANFIVFSSRLGYNAHFDPLKVTPLELQNHLSKVNDKNDKPVLSAVLLRCLAKARYSPDNKGHFGLASECYTHFTSPIRRYPDLIVHRLLRKYLFNNDFEGLNELSLNLDYLAENTSMKERRSITIERDCIDMKGAEYMHQFIGEVFEGYINGMNNGGMFVELSNGLSGCIRFEDMDDYYVVDESTYQAFGRHNHARFSLGDKVKVIIANTDKAKGTITLSLLHQPKAHKKSSVSKKDYRKRYKRF